MELGLLYGAAVGFSLGLTGSGGSILAVPLLVYGLAVAPHQAVVVSLAAVGSITLVGAVQRLAAGELELRAGFLFAAAGMLGTPAGAWVGRRVSPEVLLLLFSALMLFVAVRMWRTASRSTDKAAVRAAAAPRSQEGESLACRVDPDSGLAITSRCALLLGGVGLVTGIFSGFFGVGGGFLIVPALVLATGMNIHRAVATSLLVITLICVSGVASNLLSGRELDLKLTGVFVGGGVLGLTGGTMVSRWLSGQRLQKTFAAAIVLVAVFVVVKTLA